MDCLKAADIDELTFGILSDVSNQQPTVASWWFLSSKRNASIRFVWLPSVVCDAFFLSGDRYLGDVATDYYCEISHDDTCPSRCFSPFGGGRAVLPRDPKIQKFWASKKRISRKRQATALRVN